LNTSLSFIGCGKLGRTLGRLWQGTEGVLLHDILTHTRSGADDAVAFIGGGRAVTDFAGLQASDIFLIATPDDAIEAACISLAQRNLLNESSVVFHCSGALNSAVLHAARSQGAAVASIHPIRSFARPEQVAAQFGGTYCGVEGDQRALGTLIPLFESIGAKPVAIDGAKKILYHGAAVIAANYLVTLMDVACNTYIEAGVAPGAVLAMMAPLVRETLENVLHIGPEAALTGPIARGDLATVARQQAALSDWRQDYGALYRDLAALTEELAARKAK
jgi:predicted short-subunit dehydrogenase-like oxidoreductase (DUF2520 family)